MKSSRSLPYIALVIGVIAVSTSAIFVKLSTAPAGIIAFYRLLFASLLLLPYFLLKNLQELKTFSKKEWIYSCASGCLLAFHFILWFESLNYTSVASSVVLVTLQPLFSIAGTYFFFKESISLQAFIGVIVEIIGSVVISWGDLSVSVLALFGDFLALAACAMITSFLLFGQHIRKNHSLTAYTFIVYSFSAVILFLYCILLNYPLLDYPTKDWIYFLLLAIIPTLLGLSLFNWSLKWVSTNVISVSILLEPVGAIILAHIILDETILLSQIVGGLIIVLGILMFVLDKKINKPLKSRKINKPLKSEY